MINVTYTTEICKPYVDGIRKCNSLEELEEFVNLYWRELAMDAYEAIRNKDFNWEEYRVGAQKEWKKDYSGDAWNEKYGMIIMPSVILHIGMLAAHYVVPDGLAFMRLEQWKRIYKDESGIYRVGKEEENDIHS